MSNKLHDDHTRLQEIRDKLEAEHTLAKTEAGKHLAEIYYELSIYERQRQSLNQIRATLIVNFVRKSTDGIKLSLTNEMSTHELMMQVLQAYSYNSNPPQ